MCKLTLEKGKGKLGKCYAFLDLCFLYIKTFNAISIIKPLRLGTLTFGTYPEYHIRPMDVYHRRNHD